MTTTSGPRLRFAPSPTGSLHLGNARTALVNWLAARAAGGSFVLRIEDTDRERHVEGAEVGIMDALRWLGIDWDEGPDVGGPYGPYRQSERSARYAAVADDLIAQGAAYLCFEDPEAIRQARRAAAERGEVFESASRRLDPSVASERFAGGEPAAVRFRTPARELEFEDSLRGSIQLAAGEVEDFVVRRADGGVTYQLAVVVDDHDMRIDHVIRGQDHLLNTVKQGLLYDALDWTRPRFTHLPLVLGSDRKRLSKRHGSASVEEMRRAGVLGDALANYLVLLGWAPVDDQEVFSVASLGSGFDAARISPSNVIFDGDKLDWINQQHLAGLDAAVRLQLLEPVLADAGWCVGESEAEREWWRDAVDLVAPSAHRLADFAALLRPLVQSPERGCLAVDEPTASLLRDFAAAAEAGQLDDADAFRAQAKSLGAASGLRGRALFQPLRVALTGQEHGPELARLVPLVVRGARLLDDPPVASFRERVARATAAPE